MLVTNTCVPEVRQISNTSLCSRCFNTDKKLRQSGLSKTVPVNSNSHNIIQLIFLGRFK